MQTEKNQKNGDWKIHPTEEPLSLIAKNERDETLVMIAGRQITTIEGLEVLALITNQEFKERRAITEIIQTIRHVGALPVVPWGFGKWMGRRGRHLKRLLTEVKNSDFFLGDNGGRPRFLPRPDRGFFFFI